MTKQQDLKLKVNRLKKMLFDHFQSEAKVNVWLIVSNPLFGGMSPADYIRIGRIDKLLQFVESALDENKREEINETGKTEKID